MVAHDATEAAGDRTRTHPGVPTVALPQPGTRRVRAPRFDRVIAQRRSAGALAALGTALPDPSLAVVDLALAAGSSGLTTVPLGGFFERAIARRPMLPRADLVLYVGALGA